jgi:Flp pilus assembly protein TadD
MALAPPAPTPPKATLRFRQTPALAVLVIVAAALGAYHNSFFGPFVFDDESSILTNPSIRSLVRAWSPPVDGGITVAGRPLLNVSLALNHAVSGTAPWSYHGFNLLVHVAAGLVLFGVVRRTLRSPVLAARVHARGFEIALMTAVLWTVHPLQTESVTYVVQRAESLAGLLLLFTLWCFIRGSEAGASPGWRWSAVAACAAGMATKEVMVVAPLVVLLYDRTFLAGSFRAAWKQRKGTYRALAATWLLLGWLVANTGDRGGTFALGDPQAWWRYDLTQFDAITRYLLLAAWPHPLVIDYGTYWVEPTPAILPQVVLVGGLVIATIVALGRWPVWGFLGGWFFGLLAPSSLLPGKIQMVVEHRMYLPLAALVVVAVVATLEFLPRRGLAVLMAVALALVVTTVRRNQDYASAIGLFEDTVARRPENARAMALLADYYRRADQREKARLWLERSLAREPAVPAVLNNLATVCQELGDLDAAVVHLRAAQALQPTEPTTLNNLANALVLAGRDAEGVAQWEAALRLAPEAVVIRTNLANGLSRMGRWTEAAAQFETVVKAEPGAAAAHAAYARALQALARTTEALAELETAVRLSPRDPMLRDSLGVALARAGRMREALAQFQDALRLNPSDQTAQQNAALAAQRLARP